MQTPLPTLFRPAGNTLAETVTARLRREILSGELPPGAPLAEIPTAERLGVSRVPVREAMLVLDQEGLLEFGPRGRARVRSLSPGDHVEIYHARLPLEKEAARLVAERRSEDDLELVVDQKLVGQDGRFDFVAGLAARFGRAGKMAAGHRQQARLAALRDGAGPLLLVENRQRWRVGDSTGRQEIGKELPRAPVPQDIQGKTLQRSVRAGDQRPRGAVHRGGQVFQQVSRQ